MILKIKIKGDDLILLKSDSDDDVIAQLDINNENIDDIDKMHNYIIKNIDENCIEVEKDYEGVEFENYKFVHKVGDVVCQHLNNEIKSIKEEMNKLNIEDE